MAGWWECLVPGDPARLLVVQNDVRTGRVDGPTADVGDDVVAEALISGRRVVGLTATARAAPSAPPLWWVEVREATASPPAVNLMAFAGRGATPGALLDATDFAGTGTSSDDQAGAIRWYPATGEVDQVYVQPAWRRRSIGSALIYAAGALARARGWPVLWGDGQRTALGEQMRNAAGWRERAADLTVLCAPMTPGEDFDAKA